MTRIKKIGVLSFAKLLGVVMTLVGLLAGIGYAFGGFIYEAITGTLNWGTALAFLALLGMPVLFGICGFILGALGAFLYNVASKRFGGIELEMEP